MEEKHRTLLRRNRLYLIDNLEPKAFCDRLLQDGLITDDELDEMRGQPVRKEKVLLLLQQLPRKGPDAFDAFLKVLRETPGQAFVVTRLQQALEALERGGMVRVCF